jgi:hypothetical protein
MKHKISKYNFDGEYNDDDYDNGGGGGGDDDDDDDDDDVNHSHTLISLCIILFFQVPNGLDCYFYKILVCFLWQPLVLCSHLFKKIIHIVCVISSIEASRVERLHA